MSFTEDDVANDFVNAIDRKVVEDIGYAQRCAYDWADENDDGTWPFVVTRDGREFEVDIDVRVTELTPERKAQRAAEYERLTKLIRERTNDERTRT